MRGEKKFAPAVNAALVSFAKRKKASDRKRDRYVLVQAIAKITFAIFLLLIFSDRYFDYVCVDVAS